LGVHPQRSLWGGERLNNLFEKKVWGELWHRKRKKQGGENVGQHSECGCNSRLKGPGTSCKIAKWKEKKKSRKDINIIGGSKRGEEGALEALMTGRESEQVRPKKEIGSKKVIMEDEDN